MTEREMMLRRLSGAQFAMWETHIYLDTHPHDETALAAYKKYKYKYETILSEFEKKYGPIKLNNNFENQTFAWIKDPWPWEREDN